MSKRFVRVDVVMRIMERYREEMLMASLSFTLAVAGDLEAKAFSSLQFKSEAIREHVISHDVPMGTDSEENNAFVTFSFDDNITTSKLLDEAFFRLKENVPQAVQMDEAFFIISEGLKDIQAEKVSMDCDLSSMVLNTSFLLPDGFVLSVNKPQDTVDDNLVMFSIYHQRKLIVSDMADVSFVKRYIRNVASHNA